ncbi:MAG: type II toxin-antitoxin system VapC family toxin [Gammaproteobacteria bacterium]|nr:type II toxin-antitoxin system VapC family toxin [Gammaproteobacteria bacterium]
MKYMLDTNICIYAILGGSRYLDQRLDACNAGDLAISAVTLGELEVGFAKSDDPVVARNDALEVLSSIAVMPFDAAAARAFGRIQAAAPSRRGAYDRQIAAHAVSLGVTLVTNNEKDFHGVPEVVVENWTRPPSL